MFSINEWLLASYKEKYPNDTFETGSLLEFTGLIRVFWMPMDQS